MNNGTPSSSSDSKKASKIKRILKRSLVKNCHAVFDKRMKFNCHALKLDDDDLSKNRSKRPTFVTRPFLTIINYEVDRISLKQFEYGMDRNDYPIDYNLF